LIKFIIQVSADFILYQRKAPLTGEMSERLGSPNGKTSHQLGGRKLVMTV
jgi:hypothetical protein